MVKFLLAVPGIDLAARDNQGLSASDYADAALPNYRPNSDIYQQIAAEIARKLGETTAGGAEAGPSGNAGTSE